MDETTGQRSRMRAIEQAVLFDLQVNGFGGVDFQSADLNGSDVLRAIDALERHRVGGILATLITDSIDALCRKLERFEKLRAADPRIARRVLGYHLEGPWISRETGYHGAHPKESVVDPKADDYRRLRDAAGGALRLITLAPEVPGALELIELARADGIRVGLGHTNASEAAIDAAIAAGATLATHLGNAVPSVLPRHDNVVQRLLARDELIACLIPDGHHLPPFVLKNFFRAKGSDRVFFTTDAMAAAGAGPGRYRLGPLALDVGEDGVVRLPGDGRFAGSSLTLAAGACNIAAWLNLSPQEAIDLCSIKPAAHFGLELQPIDE